MMLVLAYIIDVGIRSTMESKDHCLKSNNNPHVTICLEGLADVVAFYWLTSMVENNP
jgi:hypothetical protein